MSIDARNFTSGVGDGSVGNPWPAHAITLAIQSITTFPDSVFLADGHWHCSTEEHVNVSGTYTLFGNSLNAIVDFVDGGIFHFGQSGAGVSITFSTFTVNANALTGANLPSGGTNYALWITGNANGSFDSMKVLGHSSDSIPAILIEGGSSNSVTNSSFFAGAHGGDCSFQIIPGVVGTNSGFTLKNCTFDSCECTLIGWSNLLAQSNTVTNNAIGNNCTMWYCGTGSGPFATNVTLDNNTINAGGANFAYLGNLPNDPSLASNVDGWNITNNTVTGLTASISAMIPASGSGQQVGDTKKNVTISGNKITSLKADPSASATIDLRGDVGFVNTVTVSNNTLIANSIGITNILCDAHTTNDILLNNTGTPPIVTNCQVGNLALMGQACL